MKLAGANLKDAHLDSADFQPAVIPVPSAPGGLSPGLMPVVSDLTAARFIDADLTEANLTGADLTDAYLMGAILRRVVLTNADLSRADLTRALWDENVPAPEGWVRNAGSGRLRPANTGTDDVSN